MITVGKRLSDTGGISVRIVVIGAGKLGYSIAELLSNEQMDVVVVDIDDDRLEAVKNTLDVLTVPANGASPITMSDPDVFGSDILVAATNSDETNMIACILAKKHGISYTAARIRDLEFLSEAKGYLKENFDIDLMINPEYITAREINRILMTPAALNVEDFAQGKVRLFETKIRKESPLADIPLKDLVLPQDVLAGLIFRDHRMIIPHGEDRLLPHDNAFFVGASDKIERFSKQFVGTGMKAPERVLIIGAGRTGRALAKMLDKQDVNVKVIEKDPERSRMVAERIDKGIVICGDGTDIDLLTQEGVGEADVVVCLTDDDKLNLMLALLATGEILAFARRGGVVSVALLEGAKAEAVEIIVQPDSYVDGKALMDMDLPRECLICAYVRDDEVFVPTGQSVLRAGDRAILFIRMDFAKKVMKYFTGKA